MLKNQGFTLVEVAMATVLVGILTMGVLEIFLLQVGQSKLDKTTEELQKIRNALIGFAIINERLPYPDRDNDGEENNDFDCDMEKDGWLPWATLGIERTDSWGNPFFYRLDKAYCLGNIPNPPNTSSNLEIVKIVNNTTYSQVGTDYYYKSNSRIIAIVLSCGQSGIDQTKTRPPLCKTNSDNEAENIDHDRRYVNNNFIERRFDDRLIWLSKTTLLNHLVKAGRLE